MAQGLTARVVGLGRNDPLFARIRRKRRKRRGASRRWRSFLMTTILNHDTLEGAVVHRVAARLDHRDVAGRADPAGL